MSESPLSPEQEPSGEARLHIIEQNTRRILPPYSQVDKTGYEDYSKENDTHDRGQLLFLYTETGKEKTDPHLIFIFRQNGFVLNYSNTPEPTRPYTLRNKNNSIFGRREKRWQIDEVEFALERARIHIEGIDHTNEAFLSQLAGWSPEEAECVTMGARLAARKQYVEQGKSFKDKVKREWEGTRYTIWDLYDTNPEKATELAVKRIQGRSNYVGFDGIARSVEDVVNEIHQNSVVGQKAVLRELYEVESYERLLKDHNLL